MGYLREQNIDTWSFDLLLDDEAMNELSKVESDVFDSLDDTDESKYVQINSMRRRVRDEYPSLYDDLLIRRESAMIGVLQEAIFESPKNNITVIVGETHVPPLYEFITSMNIVRPFRK